MKRLFIASVAMAMALFAHSSECAEYNLGEMMGATKATESSADDKSGAPKEETKTVEETKATEAKDQETSRMIQSAYPGVENREITAGGNGEPSVHLNYPVFKNPEVNQKILDFVREMASDFKADIEIENGEEKPASYDMWEMNGSYALEYARPDIVTVIFTIFNYSGGAHGMLLINCMNFNLKTGKEINFDNFFGDPAKAIDVLSELSSVRLKKELGDEADDEMIAAGTAPEKNNFGNLILQHDGLTVQFQPYQVGPWSIGPQTVKFYLDDLAPAKPSAEIWARAPEEKAD